MIPEFKKPRVWILTRNSPFQRYCINKLYRAGVLEGVVFENGSSFVVEESLIKRIFSNYRKWSFYLEEILKNPFLFLRNILLQLRYKKYYGHQEYYNNKILNMDYKTLSNNLKIVSFSSINCSEAVKFIGNSEADIIFVFGTRLLKPEVFINSNAIFVNMHWGWSPDYRAEGIVSALAYGGPAHLGVTIHLIDSGADSGDIIYQDRPYVDALDNFYSIGLKITVMGTELFLRVAQDFINHGRLNTQSQDLTKGKVYSRKYLRKHPEIYGIAWKNLKSTL